MKFVEIGSSLIRVDTVLTVMSLDEPYVVRVVFDINGKTGRASEAFDTEEARDEAYLKIKKMLFNSTLIESKKWEE